MRKTITTIILTILMGLTLTTLSQAASITGSIVYDGTAPKFKPIKMDADPMCIAMHSGDIYPQTLILGDGNTMGNVFVHITKGLPNKKFEAPTEPVILDQKGCLYDPHVLGAMVDQPIKILNPDGTLHNVHSMSKINPEFNLAMPKFRKETVKTFSKPEFMFPIKCDVHPWMVAWVAIMNHPFFNVTKEDGKFTIDNLPAGTYEVTAWHEKLGTKKMTITLAEGESKDTNFSFSRPSKK